jgi:hypothetical protein
MNSKQTIFCIVACVALICATCIVCTYIMVNANERQEQRFLINVPSVQGGQSTTPTR